MKTLKRILMAFVLLAFSQVLYAQDYDVYLQKARQRLAEGDCEGARKNYNVYKELTHKTNQSLEQMIAECGPDAPLSLDELKAAGFRFLEQYNVVKVIVQPDHKSSCIFNVMPDFISNGFFVDNMECYGGQVSSEGRLNGVVVIKGNYERRYLAYVCEGKLAFPILEIGYYEGGLFMSLQEGATSYGCIFPSWDGNYRSEGLCESVREVYGRDFSNPNVLREVFNTTIDLADLESNFRGFVRSGRQLNDSWSDDPEFTDMYEGLKAPVEGYKAGEFDEKLDQYRPISNGVLLYSQLSEFYCDGVYDSDESRYQNGHAIHIPHAYLNPDHFRVIFSFKALSNKGWCQGSASDEQWPLRMDCGRLGIRLNEDGSIIINTHDSNGKDHFYVTGYNYSVNRYVDIDMEYDHGQFIINGHRFNINADLELNDYCGFGFHSVNYSNGNAFKGYVKNIKIYSYPD